MSDVKSAHDPVTEADFPNRRYAWWVVVVLFLAYVVSFLDRQILTLLIDPIKQDLQISDTAISLLHGFTFAIFYTIFGIPLGRLADTRNRKRIIIFGVTLWGLMTAACGFAHNATMLFSARIGVAVGEAALSPSAYSMISDYFPRDHRGRAISLYSLGIFAGAGMAYIFGGLVSELASRTVMSSIPFLSQFRPWQLTFLLAAAPGVLIIALLLTIREPARKERLSDNEGTLPLRAVLAYLKRYKKAYFALLIGNSFIALANYSLFSWTPSYFIRAFEYTPKEIGMTFGLILLTFGTAGLVLGGTIADARFRGGRLAAHLDITIIASALAMLHALLMLLDLGEQIQLALIAAVVFFGAITTGLIPASLQLITPNELRGQVSALYLLLTALIGLGIGPTAVALMTDYYFKDTMKVGAAMAIIIAIALSIAVLLMLSGRKAYLQRQQQIADELLNP